MPSMRKIPTYSFLLERIGEGVRSSCWNNNIVADLCINRRLPIMAMHVETNGAPSHQEGLVMHLVPMRAAMALALWASERQASWFDDCERQPTADLASWEAV